ITQHASHSSLSTHHLSLPMSLSREQVEKVSLLARLRLTAGELERMTAQLGQIVGYVEQLAELNTDDVAPLSHPLEMSNVFRPDELRPSLDRVKMLANSPHSDGEYYLVPAVLGD
ncbi:MAG TPA: Asp-tRNA(Asn)/Glu-tRNA(Gln) amidotransferase subunit GatC, partial [Pirellulales bacterium]|nr:Asp-tRNA(Asn)/Glu-tRNA(Gln) amidotransferase subunit GatC [Pirellulales bacterium]